jgi:hypothetical protein
MQTYLALTPTTENGLRFASILGGCPQGIPQPDNPVSANFNISLYSLDGLLIPADLLL